MSDHQKNQKIIFRSELKDHLIQSLFYRKEDEDQERLNYLPKSTQRISRTSRYSSADSKHSLPSTMTFSGGGVPASLPASSWKSSLGDSTTTTLTPERVSCPRGNHCCKGVINTIKDNYHLMTIQTAVENSFLLSYIFFVLLGSLIPIQGFVEWLHLLLPDQSPIINYKKKKSKPLLSSCSFKST